MKIFPTKFFSLAFLSALYFANAQFRLSDEKATQETQNLYQNLAKAQRKGYFIGHQDDLAYGVYWKYQQGRSDVKEVVKDHPAVYGWELGNLELGKTENLDGVPFSKIKEFIKEGYRRGGIITISWHSNNPITGGNAWDFSNTSIKSILEGGDKHSVFLSYLDKIADFLADLKDDNGTPIPILWRPFHEHTGTWFWWGAKSASDEEYKELYRFSLDYLKNEKKLHHLISVYNTSVEYSTPEEFLKRYPGDSYVDMMSFDAYQRGSVDEGKKFAEKLDVLISAMNQAAEKHNKISAIGEIGYNQIPDSEWFTKILKPVFDKHTFSYVLFWRNAGFKPGNNEVEYYLPFKGHPSEKDFLKFYKDKKTLFEKEAGKMNLYK
ncbi:glycoside hydrolase family 26 protein [Chryseobacterium gambrini]|uniref:glycoside hydrolase family 26 protein n=1 Tax=Chryseobacterium gambrini TaxID=373672 RepID=UPI0022F198EB|nr:glycosyl hydrolase [Chryseobacterium gambrini]WBV53658.1 glycosyl hydrolase [Chryseobacterium gambrini]